MSSSWSWSEWSPAWLSSIFDAATVTTTVTTVSSKVLLAYQIAGMDAASCAYPLHDLGYVALACPCGNPEALANHAHFMTPVNNLMIDNLTSSEVVITTSLT